MTPDALKVNCPTCGSPAGRRCRTLTTRRTTDTHSARHVLHAELQQTARAAHPSNHRPHLRLVQPNEP